MSRKLPWFPFSPAVWHQDVGIQTLTYEERGIWFEMLLMMHDSEEYGYLSLNGKAISNERLAQLLNLSVEKMNAVVETLLDLGVCKREEVPLKTKDLDKHNHNDNPPVMGRLYNRRLVIDQEKRLKITKEKRKGGNPNFQKGLPNPYYRQPKDLDKDNITHNITDNITHNITITPQLSKNIEDIIEEKNVLRTSESADAPHAEQTDLRLDSVGSKKGTRLRRDWEPSEEVREFCIFETPDLILADELEEFRDYWIAQPGQRGVKLDWDATFRNALRKHQKWANDRKTSPLSEMQKLIKQDEEKRKLEAQKNGHKKQSDDAQTFFDEDELL